jgi:hypothetical protein
MSMFGESPSGSRGVRGDWQLQGRVHGCEQLLCFIGFSTTPFIQAVRWPNARREARDQRVGLTNEVTVALPLPSGSAIPLMFQLAA